MIDHTTSYGVVLPGAPAGARTLVHPTRYQAAMRQLAAANLCRSRTQPWRGSVAGPRSRAAQLAAGGLAMSGPSRTTVARYAARITILASLLLAGCVPVPFKPSATVTQTPVTPDNAVPLVSAATGASEAHSVAKAIHAEDPRVLLVDAATFSGRIGTAGVALNEVLAAARAGQQALAADYLLSVGEPAHRQLHDTGAAGFYFITVVGYEDAEHRDPAGDAARPAQPAVAAGTLRLECVLGGYHRPGLRRHDHRPARVLASVRRSRRR